MVAIIPRSFCNGAYYRPFREYILANASIKHIHIFESRTKAFSADDVLQENVILHLIKGERQSSVHITSSDLTNFMLDADSGEMTVADLTTRIVPFSHIVDEQDAESYFHIAANDRDQNVIERMSVASKSLEDIGVNRPGKNGDTLT